ncbi:major capsid protein [Brevundimonas sp.]|uniref:major capsid protein n=1 Tax=Brevundimonas sp. TaxID=1871086 RepID=UPI00289A4206|nr:major capsid protein [Brevundimonas sp.]
MDPEELLNSGAMLPITAAEHAGLINSIPDTFGQLNADGMFPAEGLSTPFVRVDIHDGVITALPVTEGGRPSTIARHDGGRAVIFQIPNVSHEDSVLANDLRDWQAYAARTNVPDEAITNRVETRHKRNRLKFDITREVMKMSALKGQIRDGANTLLYDLYDVFGVEKRVVYFDLDDPNFDVPGAIEEIIAGTEDGLVNDTMDGLESRISAKFYSKIISHPSVEKFFANTPAMLQLLLNQQRERSAEGFRRKIELNGVVFREYRAKVKLWGDEGTTQLLSDTQGVAYPTGTIDAHTTYAAPPLDVRELNGSVAGVDDLVHFSEEVMKHGAGLEWKYQMNALPIWKKPALLTELRYGEEP